MRTIAWGAAAWLAFAALLAWSLWREREQAIDFARRSAVSTVALLEQHTSTTFRAVQLALDDTANRTEASLSRHDEATRLAMRSHLAGMPYVRALFVVGPDGFIQHDTDYPKTPDVSLADRKYFKAHQANPALVNAISEPLQSRSGTGWFVAVTRRLGPPGGEFKGIAVAAIQLRYFSELYAQLGQVEGQQIALLDRNGRLMTWYPPTDKMPVGTSLASLPLFTTHLPAAPSGSFIAAGPPLDFERIVAYRAVNGEPLVVALAHNLDAVLAPWRRTVAGAAAALALLLVLMAVAVRMRVRADRERQRARDRIVEGEKLEALGRLTGSIAHDFNNVLGIIGNSLALAAAYPQGRDERMKSALDIGRRAVGTGQRLTHDLMSFARKRELQLARADLSELVAQMRPILEQAAGSRVVIETTLAVHLWHTEVDYQQLQVTMINLVANARDAMGGSGRIVVRTSNVDGPPAWVCLAVSDDGPGMTEEVRSHALEPFFTTKGEAGTGLGLSQVYGFMSQLGGEVEIKSSPGNGTEVVLLFRPVRD